MPLKLITAPTLEPVTFADLQEHSRVSTTADRALMESYITAARQHLEEVSGRAFLTQTWELTIDSFTTPRNEGGAVDCQGKIPLPFAPLASVTSVTYYDSDGNSQTMATTVYEVDTDSEPGRIGLKFGQSWPAVRSMIMNPIRIRYVVGWTAVHLVPQPIKQAIRILAAHWYEHRESVIVGAGSSPLPLALDSLLWQFRVKEMT